MQQTLVISQFFFCLVTAAGKDGSCNDTFDDSVLLQRRGGYAVNAGSLATDLDNAVASKSSKVANAPPLGKAPAPAPVQGDVERVTCVCNDPLQGNGFHCFFSGKKVGAWCHSDQMCGKEGPWLVELSSDDFGNQDLSNVPVNPGTACTEETTCQCKTVVLGAALRENTVFLQTRFRKPSRRSTRSPCALRIHSEFLLTCAFARTWLL
eukprot:gb/GFBE01081807.1/.p1 GENE.gb/GFBE01081807.1/~~gb/GFBE01081807.1/.p1  ORF type:complete len:208 (+),score=25.54 gb/GFBE01081807.1/:1-624(+)